VITLALGGLPGPRNAFVFTVAIGEPFWTVALVAAFAAAAAFAFSLHLGAPHILGII